MPPIEKVLVTQATATPVTAAAPIVALPAVTVQVWLGPDGGVNTVTANIVPLATAFANVNGPAAATLRLFPLVVLQHQAGAHEARHRSAHGEGARRAGDGDRRDVAVAAVPAAWLTTQVWTGVVGAASPIR